MSELIVHHTGDKVRVELRDGRTREHEADFEFSISDDDRWLMRWYFEQYLLFPYGLFKDRAEKAEKVMEDAGARLFNAVFGEQAIQRLYGTVANSLGECRITIEADDATGWALPWELMRDPVQKVWLARKAGAFVRSHPQATAAPLDLPQDLPTLNILMVIARPKGPEDVPFQSVARPLLEVFRGHRDRVNLEILRPPTFSRLVSVLKDKPEFYHVLHFDGHGAFIGPPQDSPLFYKSEGKQGHLFFEPEDDSESRPVSGGELGELLKDAGVPVVLLNACQSGMTSESAPFGSVGQQILAAGAQGAVAMGYSVYVDTAVRFMTHLYQGLVNGQTLSQAVTAARMQLWSDPMRPTVRGKVEMHDWPVPTLFEASEVQPFRPKGQKEISVDVASISGEQTRAGAEVDLPDEPDYGFIGRDSLILELERAFRDESIVLLQGYAGEGKTTAAAGFARWLAETGGLEGPAFFFQFTQHLPLSQVCDRVCAVFGGILNQKGIEYHLLEAEQRRTIAVNLLRQIPCFLIWDNFEPVNGFPSGTPSEWTDEEQRELREFLRDLRGGATKVLITSRRDEDWLGKIYRPVIVRGLNTLEARDLARKVLERAGKRLPEIQFEEGKDDPFQKLLDFLHGNPLAIQVIMGELAKGTKPETLLGDLQSGQAPLARDDTEQGREHSLAAALGYGLDQLDPNLRSRLSVLALFQGFVTDDDLGALCRNEPDFPEELRDRDEESWRKDLDAATEIGLLRQLGPGLYTIHPALPWFFSEALEKAYGGYRDTLETAYANTFGALSRQLYEQFTTNTQNAISGMRLEEANLRHALRIARRRGMWHAVESVVYGLDKLLDTLGRTAERTRLTEELLAEVTDENDEPVPGRGSLWAILYGRLADIAQFHRDLDRAESILIRLKDYFENVAGTSWEANTPGQITDPERNVLQNVAASHHELGTIAQARRRFDEAEGWYKRSLEISERIDDEGGQATGLHQLGTIAQARRRFDEAEDWYKRSLEIEACIGNEDGQAGTLHQLGRIAEEGGRLDEAKAFYLRVEDIYKRCDDPHNLGIVQKSLKRLGGET